MSRRRSTIGNSPLDFVIPDPKSTGKSSEVASSSDHTKSPDTDKAVKERLTVHLSVGLIDRLKDAVYWTPGLTMASLAEEAIARALDSLEKDRGEPIPPRGGPLKPGRRVK